MHLFLSHITDETFASLKRLLDILISDSSKITKNNDFKTNWNKTKTIRKKLANWTQLKDDRLEECALTNYKCNSLEIQQKPIDRLATGSVQICSVLFVIRLFFSPTMVAVAETADLQT